MRGNIFRLRFIWCIGLLAIFGSAGNLRAQSNRQTDSIFAIVDAMPDDTAKAHYIQIVYDSVLWAYNLPEAYDKLKLAARICREQKADSILYKIYYSMGGYCVRAGAHEYALQNRALAMEIAEKWDDSVKIGGLWGAMAQSFGGLGQHQMAVAYYKKAMPYIIKGGNVERIGRFHTFMGWEFEAMGELDSAIRYCEMGLAERERAHFPLGMYATGNSLLGMYLVKKNYVRMNEIIDKIVYAYDSAKGGTTRDEYALCYGSIHEDQNHLDSALWYYKFAASNSERDHNIPEIIKAYEKLANLLPKMGRAAEAYYYLKTKDHLRDSIKEWEMKNNLARQREIYDVESKNAEIEQLHQETTLQQMENDEKDKQRNWLISVLGVTTVLVFVAFLAYRQKRKSAILLHQQKQIIEEKNHDITDSIQYAKRIQQAILPSLQQIKSALPDSFVYFAPKDIVSGDFFWFNETATSYYLAAVDCTGHGVPGAMMSMIGYNFLGQIVNEKDLEQPAEILNELHRKVLMALNKDYTTREVKDGMDVAMIRIDKKSRKISFCGAVRPMYFVRDGVLTEIKGDIYSVGGIKDANTESFTQHELDLQPGTNLYLFSDGYADQFGGPNGKKFKYKQLRALFTRVSSLPMEEQRAQIEKAFTDWKAELEQVDDVCVVGLRIS